LLNIIVNIHIFYFTMYTFVYSLKNEIELMRSRLGLAKDT